MTNEKFFEKFFQFFNFHHALFAIGLAIFITSILPEGSLLTTIQLILAIPIIALGILFGLAFIVILFDRSFIGKRWNEMKNFIDLFLELITRLYPLMIGNIIMYCLTHYATGMEKSGYWLLISLTLIFLHYAPWAYHQFDKEDGLNAEFT